MLTFPEIFEYFDKGHKNYLVKHEMKLALLYLLGRKLRYDELKKIWRGRLQFNTHKFDKNLVAKGVVLDYFIYITELLTTNIKDEKQAQIDFKAIDIKNKGYLTYEEFKFFLDSEKIGFLNESTRRQIFDAID